MDSAPLASTRREVAVAQARSGNSPIFSLDPSAISPQPTTRRSMNRLSRHDPPAGALQAAQAWLSTRHSEGREVRGPPEQSGSPARLSAPRDRLIEALWPDGDPDLASQSMHSLVHSLHKLLGDAIGGAMPVVFSHGAYRLNAEAGVGVDLRDFHSARLGRRAASQARSDRTRRLTASSAPSRCTPVTCAAATT